MTEIYLVSYNKSQWLAEGIEKALAQGDHIKVYVVDDGSTENNEDIVKKYSKVTFIKNDVNLGITALVNKTIHNSKADYFSMFSAEDPLEPGIIKEMEEYLDENPDKLFVGSWYENTTEDGKFIMEVRTKWDPEELLHNNCFSGMFLCRRKEFFDKVTWRKLNVHGLDGYNDWDLWMQCIVQGLRGGVINRIGYQYRQHVSMTQKADVYREDFIKEMRRLNNL